MFICSQDYFNIVAIVCLVICIALAFIYFKFFRRPPFGAITMITGGVKCGKSAFTFDCAVRAYKRVHAVWRIRKLFQKMFRLPIDEEPLLYSNIPLRNVKYMLLDCDYLLRKKRFNYKSIVILDEVSLVCDSMLFRDKSVNIPLQMFFKLFGHETHGGKLFVNTQSIDDVHFALERVISNYIYIDSLSRLPFVSIVNARRERYASDKTVVNTMTDDVDSSLKRYLMLNSTFKTYDCYCYSCLTDYLNSPLDLQFNKGVRADLKQREIISFNKDIVNYAKKDS